MIKDYRFKDIEKYLKKDTEVGKEILDAFKSLSDAAIIFSPIIFGPQFLPILELLDVKDRLYELGHKVYDFIAQKVELDYLDRTEQIRAAYALICYTAYFDVLQDALPNMVRKKLKLKFEKKKEFFEESIETTETLQLPPTIHDIHCKVFYADHVTSFSEIKEYLTEIYKRICNNLIKMIREASIFDEEKKKDNQEFEKLKETLGKLPQKAIKVYEAQYIHLADQFNDFALFAQLQNFEGIHYAIEKNKTALELVIDTTKRIDVGFSNLSHIINSIATNYHAIQVQDIVDDLRKKYIALIQEPIIDDKEIKSDTEVMSLKFPKIVDAFIPQSYKCLSYQRKDIKLEDISVWNQIPVQHDLDKFFIRYLYSPDSIDYPMVILGQPGSGKSLLTKVLSAQLMSKSYTVIRIPLREVNAEDGIDVLVEDQIKKITNRSLSQGYGGFASQFKEKPLIIILDGYDELLQAKGDVFSGYLEKVRTFQQDQKAMERSVRIIITSRITLIDKARIPINSTILRLLEFNSHQRQKWIDIWNSINADYFASEKINAFSLPSKEKGNKNSIIELAEQPLLLLMLALYDSEANELAKTSNIKRTELYDNLLRRFVRRERRRYVAGFEDKTPEEQEVIIDKEMNRLGVVAIGMYNRQEVVIRSRQLEEDLDIFKARREDGSPKAHTLKESESVLGGFFFIHKSTAQDVDAHSDKSESAYEFLHNTFGEFLAADFILRNTINEVKDILVDRKFKSSGLENKLSNPDSLNSGWFNCLMFVPLYSRPVVIEMLREHIIKALKRTLEIYNFPIVITKDDFIDNLQYLVKNQLKMILNTRNSPSVMRGGTLFDREIPLLGYLSTYSLNLVILACTLSPDGFEFNEEDYTQSKVSALDSRPWDKLTSLWKVWFSPADLMGLSVILKAKRINDTVILVECNEKFEATRYEQPIDILLCVSFTLGDNLLAGLSGLQTQRFCEITRMNNKKVCEMLRNESPDIYISYLINLLRKEVNGFTDRTRESRDFIINYREVNRMIETIIHDEQIYTINSDTMLNLFEILEYCIMRKLVFVSTRKQLIKIVPRLIEDSKYISKKKYRSLEMVGGVRLIQLLTKNVGFLLLGRHEDPYFIHKYRDDEYSESVNQFLRYLSRYMREDIYILQYYEENNIYETSLLSAIDRLPIMRKGDQERFFAQFFELDSMEILAETNLELFSRAVLALLNNGEFNSKEVERIVHVFLRSCLKQLENIEMSFLGFDTIINAISIARSIHERWFLNEIGTALRYQVFGRHPRFFWNIIYLYPKFVADLIDIIPELFTNAPLEFYESPFFEKELCYEGYGKVTDYIRVFRLLYQLFDESDNGKEMMSRGLHMLERIISEFRIFRKINFSQLTIEQIDDLLWYANFMEVRHNSKEIKEALQQYFKNRRYRNNPLLKEIFNMY